MAGPLQIGDLVSLGRLAWEIYDAGWTEDRNATKQYLEFWRDVRGLAENLDILSSVITQADNSLQRERQSVKTRVRWDRRSLIEIVGDYDGTLRECRELLESNIRYRGGSGPLRNLEWNILVQPTADRLRQRIILHNSKVLHILKPFEIDLLYRVRQDIEYMHADIAYRLDGIHHDIKRLMGVLIPDLDEALRLREQHTTVLLEVPMNLAEQFRFAALTGHSEYRTESDFDLSELSDAFIMNFRGSTANFQAGMLVTDRVPPIDQYINLLKCIWLFRRIQGSRALQEADRDISHWPSYARQLEDDLSFECSRFGRELVKPELSTAILRREMFIIWPEKDPTPLVDVVTQDEMMQELLEVPLRGSHPSVEKKAKLLRRLGADGRRFRIIMSGSEQTASGRPRQQTEVIDFDITSAVVNPQYAMPDLPTGPGIPQELLIRRDERLARMTFMDMSDILKFQQAITGYKVWSTSTYHGVVVAFVIGDKKLIEKATIQLWVPKETEGSLVTNSDAAASTTRSPNGSRQNSIATFSSAVPQRPGRGSIASLSTTLTGSNSPPSNNGNGFSVSSPTVMSGSSPLNGGNGTSSGRFSSLSTIHQRQATGPEAFGFPRQTSPGPIRSSPPEWQSPFGGAPPRQIPRKPVGQPPSPRRSNTLIGTPSNSTNGTNNRRSFSVSSGISSNSNSSNSDGRSISISTGANTTGVLLRRRPPKPMLVLFTQSFETGKLSFVTVQIDEDTNLNPERCNCRKSGKDGAACALAPIEKRKGDANLAARRYEPSPSDGEMDWNMARLALNNPVAASDDVNWPNLKRLSIQFPNATAREKFVGTPNKCRCKIKKQGELQKCIQEGHRGQWGQVQEFHRRDVNKFHKEKNEGRQHVVYGGMS
ncbi:hypothetical protein NCS57_01107800 [Fusarium keratoplasticum]|uniref:Uncharacterized protein n=1 Tax=Fusarium keratoplasticum TaxID=1328300 RepID=A0ACC0QJE8_9HYPO|nr:hypothetical protein NCS57_01107800 [Fusarium keratoplasticum]KAI8657298.1 hypothetical protein NCS57_01107800 [Fusarium keratoplasticum]